jgi:hypothetical protein
VWLSLLFVLVAPIVIGVVWLSAGRSLTILADRIAAVKVPTPTVDTLAYDGGSFRIGDLALTFGSLDNDRLGIGLHTDASNMIVLTTGGRSFILGLRTNPMDASGRPDIRLIPEQGDKVSLTATHSLLGWPTPFEYTIMIQTPSWKRYVYYRLMWKKRSGAELTMLWRYEQDYFSDRGWIRPAMMWDFHTGLLRVDIRP